MNRNLISCSYVKWSGRKGNPYMKKMKSGLFVLATKKEPSLLDVIRAVEVLDPTAGQSAYVRSFTAAPLAEEILNNLPLVVETTITKQIPVAMTEFVRA